MAGTLSAGKHRLIQMLHRFSLLLMILTLGLMAWSIQRGLGQDALYQFILGASVALLFRRWHEIRQSQSRKDDI